MRRLAHFSVLVLGCLSATCHASAPVCSRHILSYAMRVPALRDVLTGRVKRDDFASYARRIASRILGSDVRIGSAPSGWTFASPSSPTPMHALLNAEIEDGLRETFFGQFSIEFFRQQLRGERAIAGLVVVGHGDGQLERETWEWLGDESQRHLVKSFPRLQLCGSHAVLSREMQDLLTTIAIVPGLADVSDSIPRLGLSEVTMQNEAAPRFDLVLLGDMTDRVTAFWTKEIIEDRFRAGATEVIVHVPAGANRAGTMEQGAQEGTLQFDYENRGAAAIASWAGAALPLETQWRNVATVPAPQRGTDYVLELPAGQQIRVRITN